MADLPTRIELFRRFRNAAIAVPNTRVSPREIDREGSDLNLIAAAVSVLGEEIVARLATAIEGVFEDTATGDRLDRVGFDRKGQPRKPAETSKGLISVSRPTFAVGAGSIQGGVRGSTPSPARIRTAEGIVYFLTEPISFGATDLGPLEATVEADLAGLAYEVADGQSWTWVDVPFDPSIVISNPAEMAGAADEEDDGAYRARLKTFFSTIHRGTLQAIQYGLEATPGIASASVAESIAETGYPAGSVQAFILDSLGRANQTLAAEGLLELTSFRAAGIPVFVIPGTPEYINVEIQNSAFDTSIVLDTSAAAETVRARIIAALNNQIPGANLLRSTILAAARSVPGFVIEDSDLIEPAATLIPSTPESAFRTRRELIAIS